MGKNLTIEAGTDWRLTVLIDPLPALQAAFRRHRGENIGTPGVWGRQMTVDVDGTADSLDELAQQLCDVYGTLDVIDPESLEPSGLEVTVGATTWEVPIRHQDLDSPQVLAQVLSLQEVMG